MTQEEINEIKEIVREVLLEDGVYIDDPATFPVTDNPGDDALAWYMTQGTQNYGRTPMRGDDREPTNIQWSAETCNAIVGAQNTFPSLSGASGLTITYTSSNTSVATINASGMVTLVGAGSCTITARFAGDSTYKPSEDSYTLNVSDTPHLSVQVGHGAAYGSASFSTYGQLTNNMIVTMTLDAGDYLFIKVDKKDTVNNLYTYPGPNMSTWEFPIALDSAVIDGDYKYYKSTNRYNAGETSYKINRTN